MKRAITRFTVFCRRHSIWVSVVASVIGTGSVLYVFTTDFIQLYVSSEILDAKVRSLEISRNALQQNIENLHAIEALESDKQRLAEQVRILGKKSEEIERVSEFGEKSSRLFDHSSGQRKEAGNAMVCSPLTAETRSSIEKHNKALLQEIENRRIGIDEILKEARPQIYSFKKDGRLVPDVEMEGRLNSSLIGIDENIIRLLQHEVERNNAVLRRGTYCGERPNELIERLLSPRNTIEPKK